MEEKKTTNQLVGVGIIAQLFGLTERRVQQLTQAGVLPATKDGRYNKYDILKTVQRYIAYLQGKAAEREDGRDIAAESRAAAAEASLKESKAGIAALELKELESVMHNSEDVKAMTTDLLLAVEDQLQALPGKLAGLHKPKTAAEISRGIQIKTNEALVTLSKYRFDPDAYEERLAAYEKRTAKTGSILTKGGGPAK